MHPSARTGPPAPLGNPHPPPARSLRRAASGVRFLQGVPRRKARKVGIVVRRPCVDEVAGARATRRRPHHLLVAESIVLHRLAPAAAHVGALGRAAIVVDVHVDLHARRNGANCATTARSASTTERCGPMKSKTILSLTLVAGIIFECNVIQGMCSRTREPSGMTKWASYRGFRASRASTTSLARRSGLFGRR